MIISIDTETGGLNPETDALLTISLVSRSGDSFSWIDLSAKSRFTFKDKLSFFDKLFHRKRVTLKALEVNKINLDEIKKKGLPTEVVDNRIVEHLNSLERLGNHLTYLGQNLKFDLEFIRYNLPKTYKKIMSARRHIELTTASEIYHASLGAVDRSNSLDNMRKELGVSDQDAHTSIKDAKDSLIIYELIKLKVGV